MNCINRYESPLGTLLLTGDEEGLTGLRFMEGGRSAGLMPETDTVPCETEYFDRAKEWLDIYFSFENQFKLFH